MAYVDALARELASEKCVRCSGLPGWKTAAMIFESVEWRYYYCYECRRWFVRDTRYRYATRQLDDPRVIGKLLEMLDSQRMMFDAQLESISWIRSKFSAAFRLFKSVMRALGQGQG